MEFIPKTSIIGEASGRDRGSEGVENGDDIDDLLNDRARDRRQMTGRGNHHCDHAQGHSTDAISSAIRRMRRLMCKNSSTLRSELSMITAPRPPR